LLLKLLKNSMEGLLDSSSDLELSS